VTGSVAAGVVQAVPMRRCTLTTSPHGLHSDLMRQTTFGRYASHATCRAVTARRTPRLREHYSSPTDATSAVRTGTETTGTLATPQSGVRGVKRRLSLARARLRPIEMSSPATSVMGQRTPSSRLPPRRASMPACSGTLASLAPVESTRTVYMRNQCTSTCRARAMNWGTHGTNHGNAGHVAGFH